MISTQTFKAVMRYLGAVGCYIFPGVFILETFFHKGLFAGGVRTLYDFILLLVWAVPLSIPYVFVPLLVFELDRIVRDALRDKDVGDKVEAEIFHLVFPLATAFSLLHFLTFRALVSLWGGFPLEFLRISRNCWIILVALIPVLGLEYGASKVVLSILRGRPKR